MIYPWQQKQWQEIKSSYLQGRLPHALLLVGSRGLGKVGFAKKVAKFILCENKKEVACGTCHSCRLFCVGNHPDFFIVTPEEKSKMIKIDQVRALISDLNQTSHCNHHQVVIIHPAEVMHHASANAFLKTLEEPTGQILLLLVSHRPDTLLPTITSRCQRLTFNPCVSAVTTQWLQKKINIDLSQAVQLLKIANQAPLYALELGVTNFLSLRDQLFNLVLNSVEQRENAIDIVDTILKENLQLILQILIIIFMDILRLQLNADDFVVNKDRLALLKKLKMVFPRRKTLLLLQQLQKAWQLVESVVAVNLRLLLEEIFLTIEIDYVC
ncbi:DNA polymerase III subunit delta' [Coxiella endosymbiont of Amblyomma nuttalli]|uniref:DNA polymerase III subunit delta' n=1 Tax=Coxiella endosymbiont of Amblyomma nuttalli TaxID=2749996 RepID=UPI001BAE3282|nr:DNA polymerase III subunit delta' [Coxiella endosymbiont of Amblyomma nuttalli]QTS84099.1 DNA polymerase III subunit delta' [Coxiella endosymbiont of Amblyomma nuttalli]